MKTSSQRLALDSKFWSRFAKTNWEKKPAAFRNVSTPLLEIDANEIFSLLIQFSDRCRRLKDADGMKLYVDGHRQFESEVLRQLPKKSDRSLEGYHARMNDQFSDYCLVCDELLQVNHTKQDQLADFTAGLYEKVGFPNRFSEMGLYLGNYRKTPFGVHVDGCGVFSFPVAGKKKFRIWKPEYVAKNPKLVRAFSYAKHKEASSILTAEPGDMTYWPSSSWHVAESDGSFSATWSLGVWVDQPLSEDISKIATSLIANALGPRAGLGLTPFESLFAKDGQVLQLPALYQESLKSLKTLSSDDLKSAFLNAWMVHTSKQGFKTRPESPLVLKKTMTIRLRHQHSPVRWVRSNRGETYCFDGQLTASSRSQALLKLIQSLNEGQSGSMKAAVKLKAADFKILSTLARAGAFVAA